MYILKLCIKLECILIKYVAHLPLILINASLTRRLMQIEQEAQRTSQINYLSKVEKEAIMKEKYRATMKPVRGRGCGVCMCVGWW